MSKSLQGKVAVVTGASKGIGAAIAQTLSESGASIVVNYASAKDDAEKVVAQITKAGGKAIAIQADVGKSADVDRLFAETKRAYGRVDVLVNNAGVFAFGSLEEFDEAEWRRQYDVNVLGPILATKAALPLFPPEGASVINVGSVVGESPVPHSVIYSGTKGALETITRALALELAPRKVRVNTLAPGGVETEGSRRIGMIGSDLEAKIVADTPLARMGQPDDIARAALFLASDDSRWITGERLTVSGGLR